MCIRLLVLIVSYVYARRAHRHKYGHTHRETKAWFMLRAEATLSTQSHRLTCTFKILTTGPVNIGDFGRLRTSFRVRLLFRTSKEDFTVLLTIIGSPSLLLQNIYNIFRDKCHGLL